MRLLHHRQYIFLATFVFCVCIMPDKFAPQALHSPCHTGTLQTTFLDSIPQSKAGLCLQPLRFHSTSTDTIHSATLLKASSRVFSKTRAKSISEIPVRPCPPILLDGKITDVTFLICLSIKLSAGDEEKKTSNSLASTVVIEISDLTPPEAPAPHLLDLAIFKISDSTQRQENI